MKPSGHVMVEGSEAFNRLRTAMKTILNVRKSDVLPRRGQASGHETTADEALTGAFPAPLPLAFLPSEPSRLVPSH